MLGNKKVIATIAVKDLKAASRFYVETLGLKREGGEADAATFTAGDDTKLIVYSFSYAGTNKATAVNWAVGADLEKTVTELEKRGVKFADYEIPNVKRVGHIHILGAETKAAWFTDPDGNIHALMGR